jgi:hypothetical protein
MRHISLLIALLVTLAIMQACYDASPYVQTRSAPTPTIQVAWPWDPTVTYSRGDAVTQPEYDGILGCIYQSLTDGNQGIQPPSVVIAPGSVYGPLGAELPWIHATSGWQSWWKRIR